DRAGESVGERLRAFVLRNPPLVAAVAALLAPAALVPHALVDASRAAVFAFVPLGFFAVGVTLAQESEEGALPFPPPLTAPVASALVLRLLVAPAVLLALAASLVHLPDAYLLMAAMPTGINTLVVAHVYRLAERVRALRVFDDSDGRMNEPLGEREILCVSQFTLYGDTRRGNRPSYVAAAAAADAEPLYLRFCERAGAARGVFGAMMAVDL